MTIHPSRRNAFLWSTMPTEYPQPPDAASSTMLRLYSGQVAITYISNPIQYQDLVQIEFTAHFTQMLRASEAALDSKHCDPPD